MGSPVNSTFAQAGTNATAQEYNSLRDDMQTGWIKPHVVNSTVPVLETWTYNAVSGLIGTINLHTGVTGTEKYEIGDKVRFKQGGGYKYFVVVEVNASTLKITGGSDYSLTNAAITDLYVSKWKAPVGWPFGDDILIVDTDGATVTFDLRASHYHQITLGGNRTFALTASSYKKGDVFYIEVVQDGTGSRTVTWFGGIVWADGATPVLTTTASKRDLFAFKCVDASTPIFLGMPCGFNM